MVVNIKECGATTKWKAQASFNGQMVVSMRATTSTTRKRATVHSIGKLHLRHYKQTATAQSIIGVIIVLDSILIPLNDAPSSKVK